MRLIYPFCEPITIAEIKKDLPSYSPTDLAQCIEAFATHYTLKELDWLLEKGADIHYISSDKKNLMYATSNMKEKFEAWHLLIDKGIDIEQTDRFGLTLFYNTAIGNYGAKELEFLLKQGANAYYTRADNIDCLERILYYSTAGGGTSAKSQGYLNKAKLILQYTTPPLEKVDTYLNVIKFLAQQESSPYTPIMEKLTIIKEKMSLEKETKPIEAAVLTGVRTAPLKI